MKTYSVRIASFQKSAPKVINLLSVVLVFFCTACDESVHKIDSYSAGDIIQTDIQQVYTVQQINQVMSLYQLPNSLSLSYSVKAVTIIYSSTNSFGDEIRVSGVLLIPQTNTAMPIMSIQHGTETKNDMVASVAVQNSVEGIVGLLTASMGYVVCIPDYEGFGHSKAPHPYMHATSLSKTVIDFLKAAKNYCYDQNISLTAQLFLMGYSEGGFATLAVQKDLEENYADEFSITAVAPMAGPYNLSGLIEYLFQEEKYSWPAYIAFLLNAYNTIYRWDNLDGLFNEPYNTTIPSFFDGSMAFFDINDQFPDSLHLLLKQEFIDSYRAGNENGLRIALEENTLLDWKPIAPIHLFHGDSDKVSPYQNSVAAYESLLENGAASIELTTIYGGNHSTSGLPAILGALDWFEDYRNFTMVSKK